MASQRKASVGTNGKTSKGVVRCQLCGVVVVGNVRPCAAPPAIYESRLPVACQGRCSSCQLNGVTNLELHRMGTMGPNRLGGGGVRVVRQVCVVNGSNEPVMNG